MSREDLPGERGLRDQAEHQVGLLAERVAAPGPDLPVLQPLVEGEAMKNTNSETKIPYDEAWDVARRPRMLSRSPPRGRRRRRSRTRTAASWSVAARRVGGLLEPAEQDHGDVGAGDADQRGDPVMPVYSAISSTMSVALNEYSTQRNRLMPARRSAS